MDIPCGLHWYQSLVNNSNDNNNIIIIIIIIITQNKFKEDERGGERTSQILVWRPKEKRRLRRPTVKQKAHIETDFKDQVAAVVNTVMNLKVT
jgi:hypothetical protein